MGNERAKENIMIDRTDASLWFQLCFGAASPHFSEFIDIFNSPEEIYEKLSGKNRKEECEKNNIRLTDPMIRKISTTPIEQAEMIRNYCSEKNMEIIPYGGEYYPESLKNIYCPPAVLFVSGNKEVLKNRLAISMVGTRNASEYSLSVAKKLSFDLANDGFVIISGFAAGVDTASHEGALEAGGRTIAVMGCGIDFDYPKGSLPRKSKIIDTGGLLVSEYPPGTYPKGSNFPVRNRIIAGLSLGTLVIQAPQKSGALITAELALETGKDVFCVPPANIFDKSYAGVIKYLREGAIPVFSHLDIVDCYYATYSHKMASENVFRRFDPSEIYPDSNKKENPKKKQVTKSAGAKSELKKENIQDEKNKTDLDFSNLKDNERKIAEILSKEGQLQVDEILEKSEMDFADLLLVLTTLEAKKIIEQSPGKIYKIRN